MNLPTELPVTDANVVDTEVLIVGAGPTGLALAISLHQAGIRTLIVDKLESHQNTSRAAVIHAHTLEVLEELGVAERLVRAGLALARFSIRDRDRVLLRLRFDELPASRSCLLMLPQDVTEEILSQALGDAGGKVQRGCTVVGLTETPECVIAAVESADGPRWIRARFVVGADGMQSLVRQTAGIGFTGGDYEESFVLADVEMSSEIGRDEVMLFFSPAGLVVVAPLPNGSVRVVATVEDAPQHPRIADIQALLDERGPRRGSGRVSRVVWGSRFRLQHRVADHYRRGRLFLVGDAAHVHSPAGGQGMNTGLVDACVLGRILAGVLSGRREEGLLDQYEAVRRPAAKQVLKLAGGLTHMATMRGMPQRSLRNLVLAAANRVPRARRRFEMNLSGLSRRAAAVVE